MRKLIAHRCNLSSLYVYPIFFGIIFSTLSSCSTQRASRLRNKNLKEWKSYRLEAIKKSADSEDEKWTIYSRKIKGTNFLEYQIEGAIAASPSACIASFRQDIWKEAGSTNNKKYPTYEIVRESEDSLLTYVIHNEPFPLKDTEMSVSYVFYNKEDGSTGVSWHEAWNESLVLPTKKLSRVETFRGSWRFVPAAGNSSEGSNSIQFDPKKMPRWLFEPMVIKFLKEGLKKLRVEAIKKI